jgi:hypothetical protein
VILATAILVLAAAGASALSTAAASEKAKSGTVVLGEVLAVKNEANKVTQVRLRRADGRFLRVELDGNGAVLGVNYSGRFAEVTGQVYLREVGTSLVRWIRVHKFRIVSRPAGWVEPALVCHEVEDALDCGGECDAGVDEEQEAAEF